MNFFSLFCTHMQNHLKLLGKLCLHIFTFFFSSRKAPADRHTVHIGKQALSLWGCHYGAYVHFASGDFKAIGVPFS